MSSSIAGFYYSAKTLT